MVFDSRSTSRTLSIDLSPCRWLSGLIGACLVDGETGLVINSEGGGDFDLELAAAGSSEVVRAVRATAKALNATDETEDVLISTGQHYHLIRQIESEDELFLYCVLERRLANLGLARMMMKRLQRSMDFGDFESRAA